MSDLLEGLGTASEGGLFARALEPDSGARKPHPDQPQTCLNCGTELAGAYCHACGQKGHLHRTIGAFMHDLLHGALHFEGKLWRTLPMLVFKPGKLTRRYIDGERARFVSPMALFLFGVFLMFAVFQVVGVTTPTNIEPDQIVDEGLGVARAEAQENAEETESRLEASDLSAEERDGLERQLAVLEAFLAANPAPEAPVSDESVSSDFIEGVPAGLEGEGAPDASDTFAPDAKPTPEVSINHLLAGVSEQPTGVGWLDNVIGKWRDNPGLMLYKLQANAYKFSWLLIPISVPFVWLTFAWRRRFKAYDHAIFVTYSLSFVTLLFITTSILGTVGLPSTLITLGTVLIVPIHLYKQLRHAYEIGRFSAFWRLLVISGFIWIAVILFLQVLFLLGAF